MHVKDIMSQGVSSCTPDASVQEAAVMMVEQDCGAIPVVEIETRKVIGVITDRDIVARAVAAGNNPVGMKVEELMTMPIDAIGPDTSLEDCVYRMERAKVRRMLVVDDAGRLCGIVSQADIARSAGEHETAELVKDVSKPTSHASASV